MEKNTAEKLYEAFYMKVFSYVMTLTGDRNDAMDITQETFLRAISTSKGFRGESECYTWLCAIAKNIFIDEKRPMTYRIPELTLRKNSQMQIPHTVSTVSSMNWRSRTRRCSS